jgi:hypothetical protein
MVCHDLHLSGFCDIICRRVKRVAHAHSNIFPPFFFLLSSSLIFWFKFDHSTN